MEQPFLLEIPLNDRSGVPIIQRLKYYIKRKNKMAVFLTEIENVSRLSFISLKSKFNL